MNRGNVPAIAGIWLLRETGRRLAESAGRLLCISGNSVFGDAPVFQPQAWGCAAALGSLHLVGDLRIDNLEELTAELGHAVPPDLDPQTFLLHAWKRWGRDVFSRLEGDFAIALWDADARQLILARDAIGQRPLHYRLFDGGVAFASTVVPLACLEGRIEPDLDRLASLLAFIPELGPRTFLAHVERVMPGHMLIVDATGQNRQQPWWRPRMEALPLTPAEGVASCIAAAPCSHSAAAIPVAPIPAAFKTFRRLMRRAVPMLAISPRLCTRLPPCASSHSVSMIINSAEELPRDGEPPGIQPSS